MTRMRTFFTIALPSALAGGVLFGSAFSHADAGMQVGFWPDDPAATVVAQATPDPHPNPHPHPHPTVVVVPPIPPVPPVPAMPAMPPMPPMPAITPDAIRQMQQEIQNAIELVRNTTQLSPAMREKIIHKLEKIRDKTAKRLAHIKPGDYEQLGEEMGKIGEDIGEEMGDLGEEMGEWAGQWAQQYGQQLGQQIGQQVGQQLGNLKFQFGPNANTAGPNGGMHIHINGGQPAVQNGDDDDDDDDDSSSSSGNVHTHVHAHAHGHDQDANDNANDDNDADNDNDSDDNDSDADTDVVVDLGDLSLQQPQRDQIQQLRANSQRQIEQARRQLQQASEALKQALDNVNASDAQLAQAIDAVSQQEATIRKAKIIAWHDARRMLDDSQRSKIEAAAAKAKQHGK